MRVRNVLCYLVMTLCARVAVRAEKSNPETETTALVGQPVHMSQTQQNPPAPQDRQTLVASQPSPSTPVTEQLTLAEAEQTALKNNPRISISHLLALAQGQATREARSAELPQIAGNLTAVEPRAGTRITAGYINNPSIFQRAAAGVSLSQLITDFGRARNLVASAQFRERAKRENQMATAQDVVLAVDHAFYDALSAQALVSLAKQNVVARQTTADLITALTKAKLKSELDLSFANVNLAQAKLLLLDANNNKDSTFAVLNTVLGYEQQRAFILVDPTGGTPPLPPGDVNGLVVLAFKSRPDLIALGEQYQAAERFRRAEHDLFRPSITALGVLEGTPVRSSGIVAWGDAVGVNISIPIFNGFSYSARAKEADYRALAAQEQVRDLRIRIARDVSVTWESAQVAYQRIAITQQLVQQANLGMDLAQTRYQLGLGSIVELSQAQLQQTQAQITASEARYTYNAALSALRFQTGQ